MNIFFIENAKMVTIIKLKKHMANACILCIIVGKFSYWKELSPIIFLVINKNPEVGFYCTVLSLGLAISLRIEGGGEFLLIPRK